MAGTDIRLLRVFDVVVRNQSFAAAQSELNVSLSTISSQISALELRLGIRLCERGRGGFRLTERGRHVFELTRTLLQAIDLFAVDVAEMRGELVGSLRLGIVDSVATDPAQKLDAAIARFASAIPTVRLELQQGSPQDFQAWILAGTLDLAIGSFPSKLRGIEYQPLYSELNTLYCSCEHPLFGIDRASISAERLRGLPAVGRSYWPEDHRNNDLFLNTRAVAQSIEQQLILIRSGAFIGFLPDHLAQPYVARGVLRQLMPECFSYSCPFDVAFQASRAGSEKLRAFLDVLRQVQPGAAPLSISVA
ncbi:MAG: LysR family transcriptional regulator [Parvibaculaceae bacterium]